MASAKGQTQAALTATVMSASVQDVGTEGAYLTQAQGFDLVSKGLASVDTANTQGDAAFVTLTEAGLAVLNGTAQAPAAPAANPVFTVRADIPVPSAKRRGRAGTSKYPIDTMEVNQSFHVPKTAENPDPANTIASSIANARIKYAVKVTNPDGSPKMVSKTVRTYKKSADGKLEKDAEGHRIIETESTTEVQETTNGRDWVVASVDASDPEGVGARVWRTL